MIARALTGAFLLLTVPMAAHAHNIGLECKLKGDKVHVEAYYDDDTPGAKAKVEVADGKNKIIASGITDAKGLWSFPSPEPGQYEVRIDAGAGHRAKKTITVPAGKSDATPREIETPVSSPGQTISEGPSRDEFTSFPWLKVAIGLSVIGMLCGAYLVASLLRRNGQATQSEPQ